MLSLILIDDQYVQNVVLSVEKSSNGKNHSSSDSQHPTNKILSAKFPSPPTISKPLNCPFAPKENILRKLPDTSITFVYLLFSIMLMFHEKSLEQIMRYKVA